MFEKCCCCVNLTTGVIVLGYLGLSLSTISVVSGLMAIYNIDEYIEKTYDVSSEDVFMYYKTAGLVFLSVFVLVNFLNLITSIYLIVGALKEKRSYLLPYIWLSALHMLFYGGLVVKFTFNTVSPTAASYAVFTLLVIFVNIYCCMCVYSLYKYFKLRELNYPAFLRQAAQNQPQYDTTYVKIP